MLGTREDMEALWENLDIIDCFATDHGELKHAFVSFDRSTAETQSDDLSLSLSSRVVSSSLCGGEEQRASSSRLPRPGNHAAAAADRRQRWTTDSGRYHQTSLRQPTPDLQPACSGKHLRGGRCTSNRSRFFFTFWFLCSFDTKKWQILNV